MVRSRNPIYINNYLYTNRHTSTLYQQFHFKFDMTNVNADTVRQIQNLRDTYSENPYTHTYIPTHSSLEELDMNKSH